MLDQPTNIIPSLFISVISIVKLPIKFKIASSGAQFAGSSSVPAHVEMMGLIGAGNNPMVGMTVACAVAVNEALNK
jgi:hypothetical protein